MSFGDGNFGRFVELAGGTNMGSEFIAGTFGTVNAEQVIASDPDQIVVTGGNWEAYVPGGDWVGMGPGSDVAQAERKLATLMERPAFTGVKAVESGQVHGIWHQFYNSPYSFVAVQKLATWLQLYACPGVARPGHEGQGGGQREAEVCWPSVCPAKCSAFCARETCG